MPQIHCFSLYLLSLPYFFMFWLIASYIILSNIFSFFSLTFVLPYFCSPPFKWVLLSSVCSVSLKFSKPFFVLCSENFTYFSDCLKQFTLQSPFSLKLPHLLHAQSMVFSTFISKICRFLFKSFFLFVMKLPNFHISPAHLSSFLILFFDPLILLLGF